MIIFLYIGSGNNTIAILNRAEPMVNSCITSRSHKTEVFCDVMTTEFVLADALLREINVTYANKCEFE